MLKSSLGIACAAVLVLAPAAPVHAQTDPAAASTTLVLDKTADGYAFASGGVSIEDREVMQAERTKYNLWVTTVAKPSGAWLAETKLRIVDLKSDRVVVERVMEGPWYMVALPPGRYRVEGTFRADGATRDQALTETVNVAAGMRQTVLRFDSKAIVSPDLPSANDVSNRTSSPALKGK